MMNLVFRHIIIALLFIVFSCTNRNGSKEDAESTIMDHDLKKQINVQNFFNTISSADEIFQIIQKTNLNYKPDFLNNPKIYKNYSLEKPRALNIGVYGADMAISAAFNQVQESMLFLKCTNYLAQELGISSAFDENTVNRLEANKEKRDSTLEIISQVFKNADKIFRENKRGELSILMITGAFIESMYVAGEYAISKADDTVAFNAITNLYIKQQESLSYLINLLQNISDKDDEQKLLETLTMINLHLKESVNNKDQFYKIHQQVSKLRKQIISVY